MIQVNRRDIARFRAVVRRCVAGRPRGFSPLVVVQQTRNGVTLSAALDEATVALRLDGSAAPSERFVVPFTALAALEGPGDGVATFETTESAGVLCRWQERGDFKQFDCEATPVDAEPASLPPIGKLQANDASLLQALHACGQSASRESASRFALVRLQLRGSTGEIAGTDGRQLLLWGGFTFPFEEELLVPALPVFGSRELAGEEDIGIGRSARYVVVAVGPWTIWLTIDAAARFPDVRSVIPRSSRGSLLAIDEVDAAALLRDLRPPTGAKDEVVPVALEFGPKPLVRWSEPTSGRPSMIRLSRSVCSGPVNAVQIDPRYLLRALSLGLREVRCTSPEVPVLFHDRSRSFLVANFGTAPAVASTERPALPAPRSGSEPLPQPQSRHIPQGEVMSTERNGQSAHEPSADDVLDPMAEAEALRLALAEVARRVGRLITALRQLQKQRRALQAAWSSLRHLKLEPREDS